MVRMGCILAFHFVSGFNGVLSHFLQSFGYAFLSSLNSIVCVLGFRFVWMTWVYPRHENFFMLMVCYLISWLLMLTVVQGGIEWVMNTLEPITQSRPITVLPPRIEAPA